MLTDHYLWIIQLHLILLGLDSSMKPHTIIYYILWKDTCMAILTTSYHISIKMISKSLISERSWVITSVYYTCYRLMCYLIFAKHQVVSQLVYKHIDQLTDKMSYSAESFDFLGISSRRASNHSWNGSLVLKPDRIWLLKRWTDPTMIFG